MDKIFPSIYISIRFRIIR